MRSDISMTSSSLWLTKTTVIPLPLRSLTTLIKLFTSVRVNEAVGSSMITNFASEAIARHIATS